MEPSSAVALPVPNRLEERDVRLTAIDKRLHELAVVSLSIERSLSSLQQSSPENIPPVLQEIKKNHPIPKQCTTPSAVSDVLEVALKGIRDEQERCMKERNAIAPFAQLPEEILGVVVQQTDKATKGTLAYVSKEWRNRTLFDAKRECEEFVTGEINTYLELLASEKLTSPNKIRVQHELEMLKSQLFNDVSTFKMLKLRVIAVRNQLVQVFRTLSKEDLTKLKPFFIAFQPAKVPVVQKLFSLMPVLWGDSLEVFMRSIDAIRESLRMKDVDTAQQLAKSLSDKLDLKSRVYSQIALVMAESGIIEEAFETLLRTKDSSYRSIAGCVLAFKMTKLGDVEGARKVREMIVHDRHKDFLDTLIAGRPLPSSLVDRSENVLAIEYALRSAIDELKAVGNFDDALSFQKILVQRKSYDICRHCLIEDIARSGDFTRALHVANQIQDELPKQYAFSGIALVMAEMGDIEGALRVADQVKIPGYLDKSTMHYYIAISYLLKGDIDQARQIWSTIDPSSFEKAHMLPMFEIFERAQRGDFHGAIDRASYLESNEKKVALRIIDQQKVAQRYLG